LYVTDAADTSLKDATACVAPILGLTHTDSNLKTRLNFSFNTEAGTNATLYLDVTVVDFNDLSAGSQYWFSRFTFEVREELPEMPTITPKLLPTPSPSLPRAPTASTKPVLVPSATTTVFDTGNGTTPEIPDNNSTDSNPTELLLPEDEDDGTATTPSTTTAEAPTLSPQGMYATVMPVVASVGDAPTPRPVVASPPVAAATSAGAPRKCGASMIAGLFGWLWSLRMLLLAV
jgi:hypothetical protein